MERACAVFQALLLLLVPLVLSVLAPFAMIEYAKLEQIDFGTTIHASFDELEPIHIALDDAITPGQGQSRANSVFILLDTSYKGRKRAHR